MILLGRSVSVEMQMLLQCYRTVLRLHCTTQLTALAEWHSSSSSCRSNNAKTGPVQFLYA